MADYFRGLQCRIKIQLLKNVEKHLKYYTDDKYFANGFFHFL